MSAYRKGILKLPVHRKYDVPTAQMEIFPVHRQFGAVLPLSRHYGAFLAEVRSTAYGDLGKKAFLNALVVVSR